MHSVFCPMLQVFSRLVGLNVSNGTFPKQWGPWTSTQVHFRLIHEFVRLWRSKRKEAFWSHFNDLSIKKHSCMQFPVKWMGSQNFIKDFTCFIFPTCLSILAILLPLKGLVQSMVFSSWFYKVNFGKINQDISCMNVKNRT